MSWVGAPLRRFEDRRLVTGAGQYVEDVRIPRAVHEKTFKKSIKQLDERNIPYSFVRVDGRNLTGANDFMGHAKTDKAMKTLWGDIMQVEVEANGGLLSRFGAKSDEFGIIFPNKTVAEDLRIAS